MPAACPPRGTTTSCLMWPRLKAERNRSYSLKATQPWDCSSATQKVAVRQEAVAAVLVLAVHGQHADGLHAVEALLSHMRRL